MKAIPNYELYGEHDPWETPDTVHCELINERSSAHGWSIKPHRHDQLSQFFMVTEGGGSASIDGETIEMSAPTIVTSPALTVHSFEWEIGSEGYVISAFKPEVASICLAAPDITESFSVPIIINSKQLSSHKCRLPDFFKMFYLEYRKNNPGRLAALRSLLSLILIELSRASELPQYPQQSRDSIKEAKCTELIELIDRHYMEHRGLEFYASKMFMTTAKISQITQSVLNVSPHKLIDRKLLLEAKRNILYTASSANQISNRLGFKDPAYFSRFFKKKTGETPGQLRKRSKL